MSLTNFASMQAGHSTNDSFPAFFASNSEWADHSADRSAAQLGSDHTKNSAVWPVVAVRKISCSDVDASDSTAAQLTSIIPHESALLIVPYLGAHQLETMWECKECNPYWYNWYCKKCQKSNKFLYWTLRKHFGHCGQSCGCCRSQFGDAWGRCECCDDLLILKTTCRTMRDLLKTYNGT